MLMIVATTALIKPKHLQTISDTSKDKSIFMSFDVLQPHGKVLFSFIKDGKLYIDTSVDIPEGMYVVPGYKYPSYITNMYGIVSNPADKTLITHNKALFKNSNYYNSRRN